MKIVFSDFDNSFHDYNFKKNINIINKFVEDGNLFIIATGRNITQLRRIINNYSIKSKYYICNDGGAIYDDKFNQIMVKNIDPSIVEEIFNYMKNNSNSIWVKIDNYYKFTSNTNEICNCLVNKIKNHSSAYETLKYLTNKYNKVHGYVDGNYLFVSNKNVSKDNAIEYLRKLNNWNKNDIYTIGDGINDYSMIEKYNGYFIQHNSDYSINCIRSFKKAMEYINESN